MLPNKKSKMLSDSMNFVQFGTTTRIIIKSLLKTKYTKNVIKVPPPPPYTESKIVNAIVLSEIENAIIFLDKKHYLSISNK